jgi:hypothetical protein
MASTASRWNRTSTITKDLAAHTLLEVISNGLSGNLTDPRQVYVLRWIAGRHAGVPEFDPPYVIG